MHFGLGMDGAFPGRSCFRTSKGSMHPHVCSPSSDMSESSAAEWRELVVSSVVRFAPGYHAFTPSYIVTIETTIGAPFPKGGIYGSGVGLTCL